MKARLQSERGQVLFLFIGIVTVVLLMAAVVVDLSLWLAERRDVQKVADLAAAAGAQDLPGDQARAIASVCDIAGANGYGSGAVDSECGSSGSVVEIELLCTNALPSLPGVCDGPAPPAPCSSAALDCDAVQVTVHGQGPVLFSSLFGMTASDAAVASGAAAGMRWGEVEIDAVVLLDATDGMAGAGMVEAKDAAGQFADFLFDQQNGHIQVGYTAYNYCYTPDWTPPAPRPNDCVPRQSGLTDLTTSRSLVHAQINGTSAMGDTNVCLPLFEARRMFFGPAAQAGAGVRRTIVILSDGDNNFTYGGTPYPPLSPPPSCRPSTTSGTSACPNQAPAAGERDLDARTNQQANALKHPSGTLRPVEIYVVGYHVCGADDGRTQASAGYCPGIGDQQPDSVADQRLLKCLASSPDHYFHVSTASELPDTFREIAARMVGRRLLE